VFVAACYRELIEFCTKNIIKFEKNVTHGHPLFARTKNSGEKMTGWKMFQSYLLSFGRKQMLDWLLDSQISHEVIGQIWANTKKSKCWSSVDEPVEIASANTAPNNRKFILWCRDVMLAVGETAGQWLLQIPSSFDINRISGPSWF